jgi:hypothetical protein
MTESQHCKIFVLPTSVAITSSNDTITTSQSSVHDPCEPDKHATAFWKLHIHALRTSYSGPRTNELCKAIQTQGLSYDPRRL